MLRTRKTLSIARALWTGMAWVNGPVLALIFLPTWTFGHLVDRGVISRDYNWVGLVLMLVSIGVAWLWWSFSVVRWRLWAFERVVNIQALKNEAVSWGLTWPDGHRFGKTEFKTEEQARREAELDPPHTILPAESDTLEYVRDISRENMKPTYDALGLRWDPAMFGASWPTTENYSIFERGVQVGALRLRPESDAIYISDLQIAAESQGRGAGTFALKFVERTARERGLRRIRLRVFTGSAAVRLYERAGFEKIADEPGKQLFERVF